MLGRFGKFKEKAHESPIFEIDLSSLFLIDKNYYFIDFKTKSFDIIV